MELSNYSPKINLRNQTFAKKIRAFSEEYSIIGVVDITGLPAPQFQRIRASLKGKAEVLIVKKNLIELVLNELESKHSGISDLLKGANGMVGLIFTNHNPFTIYKTVNKSKSPAPAKAGQTAPNDIIVPAGPTSFAPGPIIGELGALKIKAGINAGKVEIKADALVAKEGETISPALATILTRLGIEPMEVGLNIKALHEEGTIYRKNVLDVDEKAILADIVNETQRCLQLSIGINYITSDNLGILLSRSSNDSLSLALGISWISTDTIGKLLGKASNQMVGLSLNLPDEFRPEGLGSTQQVLVEEETQTQEKKEENKESESFSLGSLF